MNTEDSIIGHKEVGRDVISIAAASRTQHLVCVGQTGTGKSTLLENLIIADIERGAGVGFLDPHGSSAERILDAIPRKRMKDVIYFDATDQEYPIGLNPLAGNYEPQLIASNLVSAMKSIWSESWSDSRLQHLLYHCLAALAECENTTLLGVQRILMEPGYRRWVLKQVRDPLIRRFWEMEFYNWDKRYTQDAIAAVQNRLGQLVSRPVIRNVIGQVADKIGFGEAMDEGKIIIVNLRKGAIGEQSSSFLGSLIVTQFQLAAMSRKEGARPFYLHVDEFSSFGTTSFASMLSEARKFGLGLTLATQFTKQIPEQTLQAVFGNVGSTVAFRCGYEDALNLSAHFGKEYPEKSFVELGNFEVLVKIRERNGRAFPVQARTLPPIEKTCGHSERIKTRSRKKYGMKRAVVEQKLERWMA